MKILHVGDLAGVSCTLAKWQEKMGHQVIVYQTPMNDPMEVVRSYGREYYGDNMSVENEVYLLAKYSDIIHVHYTYNLLPKLAQLRKRIILHYHGSELRDNPDDKYRINCESLADFILVSTPDLIPLGNYEWLPTPVDTERFAPRPINPDNPMLSFLIRYQDNEKKIEHIKKLGITKQIEYIDRDAKPTLYMYMPSLLSKYSVYISIIFDKLTGNLVNSSSKTSLEALSLGLGVMNHEGKIRYGLPKYHEPEYVAKRLQLIYDRVLQ